MCTNPKPEGLGLGLEISNSKGKFSMIWWRPINVKPNKANKKRSGLTRLTSQYMNV